MEVIVWLPDTVPVRQVTLETDVMKVREEKNVEDSSWLSYLFMWFPQCTIYTHSFVQLNVLEVVCMEPVKELIIVYVTLDGKVDTAIKVYVI